MFKQLFRKILTRPVTYLAHRYSSAPKQENIFAALTKLYNQSLQPIEKQKDILLLHDIGQTPVIIFSDQHKGARDGSDDFAAAEANYMAALEHYNDSNFYFINLGDSEELWENTVNAVIKNYPATFKAEQLFLERNAYCKIIGNHDLFWKNDPLLAPGILKDLFGQPVPIYEAAVLRISLADKNLDILCTHGHQGDAQSDGNAFSKWFVSYIWGPLQSFLQINTNSVSANEELKSLHNQIMYQWASKKPNALLITGHTHQPVFESLTHLERLLLQLEMAKDKNNTTEIASIETEIATRRQQYNFVNQSYKNLNPSYFNTGCCCFQGGTITGIEIANGYIRLVKWSYQNNTPTRTIAEETPLTQLLPAIQ